MVVYFGKFMIMIMKTMLVEFSSNGTLFTPDPQEWVQLIGLLPETNGISANWKFQIWNKICPASSML